MKRLMSITLSLVTAGIISIGTVSNLSSSEVSATSSQTSPFSYSGSTDTFTVPNGVFSLSVSLSGAEGGEANVTNGGASGKGGYLSVSVDVVPGDVFKLKVGQRGQGFAVGVIRNSVMAGGWPNGGNGFISPSGGSGIGYGAGGGGATLLYKVVNNVDNLVAVAAGGGGAGGTTPGGYGGTTGSNTFSDATPFEVTREATGGNQTSGGVGACVDTNCSGDGSFLVGGSVPESNFGGGGGGGGYYGGGGGIGNGGGAGGSTWWNSSLVTRTNDQNGVQGGNGIASITFTPLAACLAGRYSATGYEPCVSASIGYFVGDTGATNQTPCPSGYTSLSVGATQCELIAVVTTTIVPPTPTTPPASTPTTTLPITVSATVPSTSTGNSPSISTSEVKRGGSLSQATLLSRMKLVVPKGGKVTLQVSTPKVCRVGQAKVFAVAKGTCRVSATMTIKKKKTTKSTSFRVV